MLGVRWLLELAVAEMCRGWGCTVRAVLVERVCLDRSQQLVGGRVEYVRDGLRDSRAASSLCGPERFLCVRARPFGSDGVSPQARMLGWCRVSRAVRMRVSAGARAWCCAHVRVRLEPIEPGIRLGSNREGEIDRTLYEILV